MSRQPARELQGLQKTPFPHAHLRHALSLLEKRLSTSSAAHTDASSVYSGGSPIQVSVQSRHAKIAPSLQFTGDNTRVAITNPAKGDMDQSVSTQMRSAHYPVASS